MPQTKVTAIFGAIHQRSQETGVQFEHMIATIKCMIVHLGSPTETYVEVKQITGSAFSEDNNIEVSRPIGYNGPLDYSEFVRAANEHYKKAVGPMGRGVKVSGRFVGSNNVFDVGATKIEMDCEDAAEGAW
jgi:hypothetical protein